MNNILTFIKEETSNETVLIKYLKQVPRLTDYVAIGGKIGRVLKVTWTFGNNEDDQQTVYIELSKLEDLR